MWALAFDVAKFCDPADPHTKAFFRSWKRTLPCRLCRDSYRSFYERHPPPPATQTRDGVEKRRVRLLRWLHWLKDQVQEKLRRQGREQASLSWDKFLLRAQIWTSFGHARGTWDLLYTIACNYPEDAGRPKNDAEAEKLTGYARFYPAVAALSRHIPYLVETSRALERVVWSKALPGRSDLLKHLHAAAVAARCEERPLAQVVEIYSQCDSARH